MKRNNAYLFETDTFAVRLYDDTETVDIFGQDYLEDYGHTVPPELIERYRKAFKEMQAVQDELRAIIKKQEEF